ncbi:MAG TPA: BON domain-containing protein [Longimicrobiales bacterium]
MAGYDDEWRERQRGWSGMGRSPRRPGWGQGPGGGGNARPWMSRPPWAGYGAPYDLGYQGGEFGRSVNARSWRGSYGTPPAPAPPRWSGEWQRPYRGDEYNAAHGRGYEYDGVRRGRAAAWDYRRDYDQDFGGRLRRHYGRTPTDRWPAEDAGRAEARMSDEDVLDSVRENLFQDTFIDPDRIEVEVERGVVTLRGEVDDFLEARYAWDDAWESPGVRGVINNLTVRTDRASDEMDMPQTTHQPGE